METTIQQQGIDVRNVVVSCDSFFPSFPLCYNFFWICFFVKVKLCFGLVFTIFNEGAYLTFKSISHKALNLF